MKTFAGTVIALLLWSLCIIILVQGCLKSHAQSLVKKITPEVVSNVRPDKSQGGLFDTVLFRADSALRIGDTYTTHRLLSDPCRCFYEADPIAPKGSGYVQIALFQYAALMALQKTHSVLVQSGHKKWARTIYIVDIVSESYAVGHNSYLLAGR